MTAADSLFAAGTVLLWPAVAVLAARIGVRRPELALWGGTCATLGLLARTFHAGVDHLAFQLVGELGLVRATQVVGDSYGAFHIFSTLNAAIMGGWVLLAFGSTGSPHGNAMSCCSSPRGCPMPRSPSTFI